VDYYRKVGTDEFWNAYGMALARLRSGDPVGAAEAIDDRLDEPGADHLAVALLLAEIDHEAGRGAGGFEELVALYPENRAVARAYAEALLETPGQAPGARAERLLRPLLARYPADGTLYETYARAADRAGMPVRAKEAFAQHVFLQGRVYDAVTQLRGLLDGHDLDYYQRSRIEARLSELEPVLAEIERNDGWDPSEGNRNSRGRHGPGIDVALGSR